MAKTLSEEMLLGIDYGETNIGLAFGRNGLVMPTKVVSGKNSLNAIQEIIRLLMGNDVDRIVIGLPTTGEGKETAQSKKVRVFAKLLKTYSKKPVEFFSEFMTTKEANSENREKKLTKTKKSATDHLAAALILKRFYQEHNL